MIWLLQIPAPLLGFVTVALVVGCPSADCSCSEKRCRTLESRANDFSGQVFQLAGVLYAVLVAFVVVWEQFGDAENATQAEASAIADLLRDSTAIPAAYRPEVQRSLVAYTEDVINDELPRMRRGETIEEESDHTTELWTAFLKVQPESRNEIAFFDRDIVKLNSRSLGSCGWGRSDGGFEGFVMYLIFARPSVRRGAVGQARPVCECAPDLERRLAACVDNSSRQGTPSETSRTSATREANVHVTFKRGCPL